MEAPDQELADEDVMDDLDAVEHMVRAAWCWEGGVVEGIQGAKGSVGSVEHMARAAPQAPSQALPQLGH